MVQPLSQYVIDNAQRAVKGDLHQFMLKHPKVCVEPKIDGTRVFLFSTEGKILLATKHNGVYSSADYPDLFKDLKVKDNTIVDGELVRKSQTLYVFDVLFYEGKDVRRWKLGDRQSHIHMAIEMTEHVPPLSRFIATYEDNVRKEFERAVEKGHEGIMVKDEESRYGSPNSWLKMKNFDTVDCFVVAFKETDATKERGEIWSYSISVYDQNGNISPLGDVSSCIASVDRSQIKIGTVLEVRHQPTEGFKALRHPTIMRIRDDKTPQECSIDQLFGDEDTETTLHDNSLSSLHVRRRIESYGN